MDDLPIPILTAGIRNFAWVERGVVARGEQPPLQPTTFTELKKLGISAIVSLRPDREAPSTNSPTPLPEYHVEEEQALVEAAGLRFAHTPIPDFTAPSPDQLVLVLTTLDQLVREQPGVYVHCRAGAGRTSLITCAWSIARGASGDDAARTYARFMTEASLATGRPRGQWPELFKRVGQPYALWGLHAVAAAMGSPVSYVAVDLLPPQKPPDADHWEERYREVLEDWRRVCS